jgi:iron complex outermembrane receptor protein
VPAVERLSLSAAVNYNHARYGSFDTAPCYGGQTIALGCNRSVVSGTGVVPAQDLSDKPLMRAPEWSANLGFDYEMSLRNGMTLAVAANALYSDEYYTNLLLRSDMVQDSFVKTGASVALRGARDAWEIALIGNNLGNELISGNCVNGNFANGIIVPSQINGGVTSGPAGVDELACNVEPGREVWIRVTVKPLAFRQ